MTTMTRSAPLAETRHHAITTYVLVVLFWALAAILVGTAHLRLDRASQWGGAATEIGAVIVVAFIYMRFVARQPGVDHALLVGVIWLLLAIVGEIAVAGYVHHGWFALLGSPARPMLRNVFLFVWVFAPALFARREAID